MNLKESVSLVQKKGIFHLLDKDNKVKRHKPWLGDIFSVFYERMMEKSVFPKKFSGSMSKHYEIIKHNFEFEVLPYENGALIYFKARMKKD
jgi:hypothetical protein